MRDDCIVSEYDIREDVMIGECKKRVVFKVSLQKDDCEVTCSCLMFEFRGIVCRHALAVLIHKNISLLPEKYIIRRWKKGIKRCHTRVKIDCDGWSVTTEQRRYDKMCTAFTKVADLAADDEESYTSVMDLIENAMNELSSKKTMCGRNQANPTSLVHKLSSNKINNSTNDTQNILDPIATRSNGAPRSKRKKSTVCKKQKKKKLNLKDSQTTGPSSGQMTNVIPIQESIATAGSQNIRGINFGTSSSQYPTLSFNNTNMTLLWGVTPGAGACTVGVGSQLQDPQYQFWNGPYGMQVMPNYGSEVMVELLINVSQVQGDGTPNTRYA